MRYSKMEPQTNETLLLVNYNASDANFTEDFDTNATEKDATIRSFLNNPYHMLLNYVWTCGFSLMVVMGVFGNGFVLWIILGKSQSRVYLATKHIYGKNY